MSKIQNKVYLNNLHNLSFPKSPKTLNLDKPTKSYKRYKIQGSKNNKKDLSVMVKGPNVVKGNPASKPTRISTRASTDMRGRSAYVRARAHKPLTCGVALSVSENKIKGARAAEVRTRDCSARACERC